MPGATSKNYGRFYGKNGSFADAQALWSEYSTQERVNEAHESSMGQLETEVLHDESLTSSDDTESVVPDDLPLELVGIEADKHKEDIHPLYDQFQSEIGNLGVFQESWDELQAAKQNIDYKLSFTHLTEKVRLTEEEEDLLAEFPDEEYRIAQDLRESAALARRLRALCQEKGVLGQHLSFNMTYLLHKFFPCDKDNPELGEDLDLLEKPEDTSSTLARPLFPRLLSQSAHLFGDFPVLPEQQLARVQDLPENDEHKPTLVQIAQEEVFLDRIFTDCNWKEPRNFVDRWLFHQLRSSSHVALTAFNTFEDTADSIDLVHWQERILDTWWDASLPISPPQDDSSIGQGDLSQPNSTIYAQEVYSMDNVVLRMLKAV
ncbi:unnamed protein product [Parascedosporium putredinis]|uniref:Uncharacterized protein n=1 Tax=Parascedosporium putredinis TaxID=1442378 RepID=A0A9P1GZ29_9PEZI|nr:unnamed protein product [Parascedosporium putredinis]CAI7991353.1 unnamed protein product [Parascedosporium putredinis]